MKRNHQCINLGILAHVDAGKTTVTEALLVHSGVKREMGRVDSGTTTTDGMRLERQRGMTIRASTVSFTWEGVRINLIDTPGHMEFIAEVERSLTVLDGVILVLSAREGVQSQTRVIFSKLRERGIPVMLFVNKLDRVGVDLDALARDIRDMLTPDALWMQTARGIGTRDVQVQARPMSDTTLYEAVIERSDALMTHYIAGLPIPEALWEAQCVELTRAGALVPVWMGVALHDIGIETLLAAIPRFFQGRGDPEKPLSAVVYKVEWDEAHRKRIYLRVFEGVLALRARVSVLGLEQPLQVATLYAVRDGQVLPTRALEAGDIGLTLDSPALRCGDILGEPPDAAHSYETAVPLMRAGIWPEKPAQRTELLSALMQLTQEDPFLQLQLQAETGEICLRLFGALQVEILQALLVERYGLEARFSALQTVYKLTPRERGVGSIRISTPGNHLYAGMVVALEPLPMGSGIIYETKVSYGELEKSFQNAAREGVLNGLAAGLGDDAVIDVKATFLEADYDSVMSTPAEFRRLAPQVVRQALESVGTVTLEPWQRFLLRAPMALHKPITAHLYAAQAVIEAMTVEAQALCIQGRAPLADFQTFPVEFQVLTQNKGMLDVRFDQYRQIRSADDGAAPEK